MPPAIHQSPYTIKTHSSVAEESSSIVIQYCAAWCPMKLLISYPGNPFCSLHDLIGKGPPHHMLQYDQGSQNRWLKCSIHQYTSVYISIHQYNTWAYGQHRLVTRTSSSGNAKAAMVGSLHTRMTCICKNGRGLNVGGGSYATAGTTRYPLAWSKQIYKLETYESV